MNKKTKLAIPFAVLSLSCGVAVGVMAGCNQHKHSYTEFANEGSTHVMICPDCPENAKDEGTRADHKFDDGACECGAIAIIDGTVAGAQGSISLSHTVVNPGDSVTVTVTPNEGWQLKDLTINGDGVFGAMTGLTYTFVATENTTVVAEFEKIASSSINSQISGKKYGVDGNSLTAGDEVTLTAPGKADVTTTLKEDGANLVLKIDEIAGADWSVVVDGYAAQVITVPRDVVYTDAIALEYDLMENLCTAWGQSDKSDLSKQNDGSISHASGYYQWVSSKKSYNSVAFTGKVVKGGFRQGIFIRFKGQSYADDGFVMLEKENQDKICWMGAGDGFTGSNLFNGHWDTYLGSLNKEEYDLTLVREANKFHVFIDGTYYATKTLGEEYAEKECYVGMFCTDASRENDDIIGKERTFTIDEDVSKYIGVEITDDTAANAHGTLTISKPNASKTDKITLTVAPETGYTVSNLLVGGQSVMSQLKYNADTKTYTYEFTVMEDTQVSAEFVVYNTVESLELTVNAAAGFTANGTEITLEQLGKKWTGTVADGKVTITDADNPVAVGTHKVTANVNGLTIGLGEVVVAQDGTGTLTLNGNTIFAKAECAAVGYDLNKLEITLNLKNDNKAYHNQLVKSVPESDVNYLYYKISLPEAIKTKLTQNSNKEINFSMPIVVNGDETTIRFLMKNGEIKYQLYGGAIKDATGEFWGTQRTLGAAYWTALTNGDGFYFVACLNKTDNKMYTYFGTDLAQMHVAPDFAKYGVINSIGISMGSAYEIGNLENGDQVTIAVKYGKTMTEIGMGLEDTVDVNLSVNSDAMGEISSNSDIYYVGDSVTVTLKANAGYFLKSLKISNNEALTSGWTENGSTYTYTFIVPEGGATVLATFEKKPTANVTFTFTGATLANGTSVEIIAKADGAQTGWLVGGEAVELILGEYEVFVYGYNTATVTVAEGDTSVEVALTATLAHKHNDSKNEITVDETAKMISFKGNGLADREPNERKIDAEYVISDDIKNATEMTLTFTVKGTKKDGRGGNDWVGSRFGVQIGEGEIGFMVFPRNNNTGTAADVGKLRPNTNLSLNPDRNGQKEHKWHGDDTNLAWLASALFADDGVDFKVVRTGGVIHIYAINGSSWFKLDEVGTSGETVNPSGNLVVADDLAIADSVKNQIKFMAGGDNWTFSNISVKDSVDKEPATVKFVENYTNDGGVVFGADITEGDDTYEVLDYERYGRNASNTKTTATSSEHELLDGANLINACQDVSGSFGSHGYQVSENGDVTQGSCFYITTGTVDIKVTSAVAQIRVYVGAWSGQSGVFTLKTAAGDVLASYSYSNTDAETLNDVIIFEIDPSFTANGTVECVLDFVNTTNGGTLPCAGIQVLGVKA